MATEPEVHGRLQVAPGLAGPSCLFLHRRLSPAPRGAPVHPGAPLGRLSLVTILLVPPKQGTSAGVIAWQA